MPRHPEIADHAKGFSDRVYSTLYERARAKNEIVYSLHVGDTYREPVVAARAESQLTADHPRLHNYAPVQGEPELLDAIERYVARRHDVRLPLDRIQVMSGATAGLNVVCQVLLAPGDEVLLPSPFWPLSRGCIATKGAAAVQVPFYTRLSEPGFDPEAALEAAVTDRTVALYINTPHNPTSRELSEDVITAVLRVAKRHDLWVLSDEAYEELYFGETPRAVWTHPDAAGRTIACHTLSKSFGIAGSRVGFTHGPEDVMRAIRGMQTFQTYCAPRPLQFGGARALEEGESWLRESRALYKAAGDMAADALGVQQPDGGTFLFLDVTDRLDGADTCRPFLERCADEGVLLTPGASCGEDYPTWVRLCFTAVDHDALQTALARVAPIFGR